MRYYFLCVFVIIITILAICFFFCFKIKEKSNRKKKTKITSPRLLQKSRSFISNGSFRHQDTSLLAFGIRFFCLFSLFCEGLLLYDSNYKVTFYLYNSN